MPRHQRWRGNGFVSYTKDGKKTFSREEEVQKFGLFVGNRSRINSFQFKIGRFLDIIVKGRLPPAAPSGFCIIRLIWSRMCSHVHKIMAETGLVSKPEIITSARSFSCGRRETFCWFWGISLVCWIFAGYVFRFGCTQTYNWRQL